MSQQTIEAEGPSLEAARLVLQQKLQPGHVMIKETVLSDGSSKKVSGSGSSLEQARQQAQSKIPANATIEKVNVIREPTTEVRAVEAFDEGEARKKAGVSLPHRIESISIAQAGRKGIFGIGRSPSRFSVTEITQSRFSVTITAPAEVEFIYRPLVTIRAIAATPDMVPSMKASFWKDGSPMKREYLNDEQEVALLGLSKFARAGNPTAGAEIASILSEASNILLDVGEFSAYHGYQRQKMAAKILGMVGGRDCIQTLEKGRRLQVANAGCSQYSNESSREMVEDSINEAIRKLQTSRAAN